MNDRTAASHEDLVAQAASNGWDFFDGPSPEKGAAEKVMASAAALRIAQIAAALDTVPEFQELLAFLAKHSLHRVDFVSGLGLDPMQAYCFGVFREGQKAMLFSIYKLIAEGRDQQIERREP
jgi:hypothetical protein